MTPPAPPWTPEPLTPEELDALQRLAEGATLSACSNIDDELDKYVDENQRAFNAYHAAANPATLLRLLAQVREAEARLDRARAAMAIAMDALESDADKEARCKAFEICQGQFEGVTDSGYESLRDVLNAEHAQWEAEGYGMWPAPSPANVRSHDEPTVAPWPESISDGLTLPCGVCHRHTDFDYTVSDNAWASIVPSHLRLGVICLPCFDVLGTKNGFDVSAAIERVQWTGRGKTVVLTPTLVHRYNAEAVP